MPGRQPFLQHVYYARKCWIAIYFLANANIVGLLDGEQITHAIRYFPGIDEKL